MKWVTSWKHKIAHCLELGLLIIAAVIFRDIIDLYFIINGEKDPTKKIQKQTIIYTLHLLFIIIFDLLLIICIEYFFDVST